MNEYTKLCHVAVALFLLGGPAAAPAVEPRSETKFEHFITRKGNKLMDGEKVFRFIGAANTEIIGYAQSPWYVMPPTEYELRDAFQTMRQMGQQAVRTYAFTVLADHPQFGHVGKHVIGNRTYNEEAFRSFDKMLQIADEYGVRVIVPFLDVHSFGANQQAFAQMHGAWEFYRDGRTAFKQFISDLATRRNTFTGRLYRDEKAILAWQLGNELSPPAEWESEIAAHLKKVAPNHLVASGLRGLHRNSIADPNLDIIDFHPYPGPPQGVAGFEAVARMGKVVIFGEFGGKGGGAAVRPFLDAFIASEIAGANWWAVISRYRWGGYGRFQPESVQGYSRLHWPYWDSYKGQLHDVPDVLTALQDAAFKLQGRPVPEHRVPKPTAPELLPIDDPLRIGWRGPTGARWYDVQRAESPKGPWTTVGERVSDHCVPGWFGAIFAHKDAPQGQGFYRVRAANEAGVSPWSKVVEVGAPHPVMTQMYLGPNLLTNWSFEDDTTGWSGIDGKTAVLTKAHRFSGAFAVEIAGARNHTLSQRVRLKPKSDYLWVFHYRNEEQGAITGRVRAGDKVIAHFPGRRSAVWHPWSLHFNTGIGEDIVLTIECSGSKIHVDDCVLVENPQWVEPADRTAVKPARVWTGGGADSKWSTPENWERKSVPGVGDTVHHRRKNVEDRVIVDRDIAIAGAWVHWDHSPKTQGEFHRALWIGDTANRTVTITDSIRIMNAGRSDGQVWTNGTVSELIVSNLHVRIGTEARPAEVVVARDESPSAQSPRTGRLAVRGGSVRAWLSYLGIGQDLGSLHGPSGVVDWSGCTDVVLRVSGDVDIGHMTTWEGNYHTGAFSCGGGSVTVGGNLRLADARDGRLGDGSSGRLDLVNTCFAVNGQAVFSGKQDGAHFNRRRAWVVAVADGRPSGLDLTRDAADALLFTFGKQNDAQAPDLNRMAVRFTGANPQPDADGWYWGLRWAGDRTAVLRGYLAEPQPRLLVDFSALSGAARNAHRAYLAKRHPDRYAGKKAADLAPEDFVVYDDVSQRTYVGVRCRP